MALLLAILMWVCSSCEKKPVYTGEQKIDSLMAKLRREATEGYLDTAIPGWRIRSSDIKDAAITEVKHTCDSFNQSEAHKIQMQFDSLLIEYDKARNAFNKAKNWDQQTIAWERQYKILLQEMELVKKRDSVIRVTLNP